MVFTAGCSSANRIRAEVTQSRSRASACASQVDDRCFAIRVRTGLNTRAEAKVPAGPCLQTRSHMTSIGLLEDDDGTRAEGAATTPSTSSSAAFSLCSWFHADHTAPQSALEA